jgi:hypothetical protein
MRRDRERRCLAEPANVVPREQRRASCKSVAHYAGAARLA